MPHTAIKRCNTLYLHDLCVMVVAGGERGTCVGFINAFNYAVISGQCGHQLTVLRKSGLPSDCNYEQL